MKTFTKSIKGKRGFSKMYKVLGECKSLKVPLSVYDKIKNILLLLESIGDLSKIDKILDNIISGLENISIGHQ